LLLNLVLSGESIDIGMVKAGLAEVFEAAKKEPWILTDGGYDPRRHGRPPQLQDLRAFVERAVRAGDAQRHGHQTSFNRHHVVDIAVPPETPFPLETLSYVATGAEIERAGGAKGFVQSLIAAAESTAAWREYASCVSSRVSPAPHTSPRQPRRPWAGRRRLKLSAPRR
jgi:hypothetical protein